MGIERIKIITVFGTRPEAIKMCPIILQMKKTERIKCVVCLTGQHREMLHQVMERFAVWTDYDLDIMQKKQSLTSITEEILKKLEYVLKIEKPDLLLVHGDTTTSFSAALAAFYHRIPIGHVEAGLRTYRMHSPYPEEFNRQAVDLIADIYFAPTEWARQNLLKEGKPVRDIYVTGNTAVDALSMTICQDYDTDILKWCSGSRFILLTAHRRENLGEPMRRIFRAIRKIVEEFPDVKILYPIHKNPQVRETAQEILSGVERIRLVEPLDIVDFHNCMAQSYMILTDSGGIQEEAPSLGKPVLVMRDTTERPEGVETGVLKIVGTEEERVYWEIKNLLTNPAAYQNMSRAVNPYGDGHASERIVEAILRRFYREEKAEDA